MWQTHTTKQVDTGFPFLVGDRVIFRAMPKSYLSFFCNHHPHLANRLGEGFTVANRRQIICSCGGPRFTSGLLSLEHDRDCLLEQFADRLYEIQITDSTGQIVRQNEKAALKVPSLWNTWWSANEFEKRKPSA